MDDAIQSFDRLADSRYLNRAPLRIDVVRAPRSAPFSTFLRGRPSPYGIDEAHLAILNQVEPNEVVPSGAALKLPTD
jgi:hypothetical protein